MWQFQKPTHYCKIKLIQWKMPPSVYTPQVYIPTGGCLTCSWWWLEVTLVHVGTHNYHFPKGGTYDQWESDLTLCTHPLESQIINWFISPPLPSLLFRGLSKGVHYLFMERRFIQFAGDPIRTFVWMHGKGAQGQVNYSIMLNV